MGKAPVDLRTHPHTALGVLRSTDPPVPEEGGAEGGKVEEEKRAITIWKKTNAVP